MNNIRVENLYQGPKNNTSDLIQEKVKNDVTETNGVVIIFNIKRKLLK